MHAARAGASLGVGLLATLLAACASPAAPTVPSVVLGTSAVSAVTITGLPETLGYGQSIQLKAIVTLPDGVQKEAATATWQSSDTGIVTVSESGLLAVTGFGDADITATVQDVPGTAHVSLPVPPAPIAHLDVKIDEHGSTVAAADATELSIDLSGSSGTGLRYLLELGDGTSSSEPITRHVYRTAGEYRLRSTVTDALGRSATATRTISVFAFSHRAQPYGWYADLPNRGPLYLQFDRRSGASLSGKYVHHPSPPAVGGSDWTPLSGRLDADNTITLRTDDGTVRMTGYVRMLDRCGWICGSEDSLVLTFAGGAADGMTLTLRYYQPF